MWLITCLIAPPSHIDTSRKANVNNQTTCDNNKIVYNKKNWLANGGILYCNCRCCENHKSSDKRHHFDNQPDTTPIELNNKLYSIFIDVFHLQIAQATRYVFIEHHVAYASFSASISSLHFISRYVSDRLRARLIISVHACILVRSVSSVFYCDNWLSILWSYCVSKRSWIHKLEIHASRRTICIGR